MKAFEGKDKALEDLKGNSNSGLVYVGAYRDIEADILYKLKVSKTESKILVVLEPVFEKVQ